MFDKWLLFVMFLLVWIVVASNLDRVGLDVSTAEVLVFPTLWLVIGLYARTGGK